MDQPGRAKHILFCNCGGERIQPDLLSLAEAHLRKLPVQVTKMSDLCCLVAHNKEQLGAVLEEEKDFLVIGCYRRTMNLMMEQVGKNKDTSRSFNYINLIETSAGEVVQQIDRFCSDGRSKGDFQEIREGSDWPSWYPVIDYERCTACGQCADFCLFGVYEKTGDHVRVVYPEGCKNNCPACGRICPSTALIFPKYKHGGAIGGSEDIDENAEQQRQALDVESILGGDIYAALEKRKARRQSIIREEAMKKAFEERDHALKETVDSK